MKSCVCVVVVFISLVSLTYYFYFSNNIIFTHNSGFVKVRVDNCRGVKCHAKVNITSDCQLSTHCMFASCQMQTNKTGSRAADAS